MSDEGSDVDEQSHEKLLQSIRNIGHAQSFRGRISINKSQNCKVTARELVGAIHSTRNLDDVQKQLSPKNKTLKKGKSTVLPVPLHRQARERIESSFAYAETKKDLKKWAPIVEKNRLADQLCFPLNSKHFDDQSGIKRISNITPRTPLEVEMATLIGKSKSNLRDGMLLTEAEQELMRAMNVEEAREKLIMLQKMRFMISSQARKYKRLSKIKSKSYHRRLKQGRRKQLIKEFDEILAKNPQKAKEKLAEIEQNRILERATLKHRHGGKKIKWLAKHAATDPQAKKIIEEQIRLGRELAEKHSVHDGSCSNDETKNGKLHMNAENLQIILEKAAEDACLESTENIFIPDAEMRSQLRQLRDEKQLESFVTASKETNSKQPPCQSNDRKSKSSRSNNFEETVQDGNSAVITDDACTEQCPSVLQDEWNNMQFEVPIQASQNKKKKEVRSVNAVDSIDAMFDSVECKLIESTSNVNEEFRRLSLIKKESNKDEPVIEKKTKADKVVENSGNRKKRISTRQSQNIRSDERGMKRKSDNLVDISLDPKYFLKADTKTLTQVSADLLEKMDNFESETDQEAMISEVFYDDDVIADFEAEKAAVEEAEKSKDIDLTLDGWGSWTGPGMEGRNKKRYIIKGQPKKRKDEGRNGIIISESSANSIYKFQPKSVPFPYTRVEDYEAIVKQPIGKEWNPQNIHLNIIKPAIVTQAGRIIRPIEKGVLKHKAVE